MLNAYKDVETIISRINSVNSLFNSIIRHLGEGWDRVGNINAISIQFIRLKRLIMSDNNNMFNAHLSGVNFLILQLDYLSINDFEKYQYYVRILKKHIRLPSYEFFSTRFEIAILCGLLEKGVSVIICNPPDFIVNFNHHQIYIECTSARLTTIEVDKSIEYKVLKAINNKQKKFYNTSNCILCIDITNLNFTATKQTVMVDDFHAKLKMAVLSTFPQSKFASILLFSSIYDSTLMASMDVYLRIDNPYFIDASVLEFLDFKYPIESKYIESPMFPIECV